MIRRLGETNPLICVLMPQDLTWHEWDVCEQEVGGGITSRGTVGIAKSGTGGAWVA